MKWLEPSLEEVLKKFKNQKVLIYPISFIIDNSETDLELAIEYGELAKELNIDYKVSKVPNDDDRFVEFLKDKIEEVLR
jgi:ferrochelatase